MSPTGRWALVADVVVQAALYGLAGLLPMVLHHASKASLDHAFTVLSSGIAMAAAILLALATWLSTNGRLVRIAFAVMVYAVFLFMDAIEPDPTVNGLLVSDLALIGVAVLCGLALRRTNVVEGTWRSSALIGIAVLIGCAIVSGVPDTAPAAGIRHALDVSAWAATAVAGLALVCCGVRGGKPLLRRVGLALLTLTAAPVLRAAQGLAPDQPSLTASALVLAGVAMLLAAAVPYAVSVLRTMWEELTDSQSRLVAGRSGAGSVLAAPEVDEDSPQDRRQLRAVGRAELKWLRRILDSKGIRRGPSEPSSVAVAPLLSELAALHGAAGAAIELHVANDLQALMSSEGLAHIVTNLLVNCARHAPGARVSLDAFRCANRVVIKVTDDGPGLAPGLTTELLRPGMRGPSSTGTGLGLHVSAELASRHGGAIRLVPTPAGGRGCTVVVELPAATVDSRLCNYP